MVVFLLVGVIWHPQPYNTEQVCFDDDGSVLFYAQGFSPNSDKVPVIRLTEGVYKIRESSEKLYADCTFTWGANKPKGREYWETKED